MLSGCVDPLRAIGYHGTSRAAALAVLRDGFRVSRNEVDWLGDGVYFFQDAPNRAREWAAQRCGNDGVVIRSVIRLDDCLDLLDIEWNDLLVRAYHLFVERAQRRRQRLPRQTSGTHRLDRAVVNYAISLLASEGVTARVVRGVFAEGVPVFPESAIMDRAHVQIAVRDASLIEASETLSEEGRRALLMQSAPERSSSVISLRSPTRSSSKICAAGHLNSLKMRHRTITRRERELRGR